MTKPESIVRTVGGVDLINPKEFSLALLDLPIETRLMGALALAGAKSWDNDGRYIAEPKVSVVAINGATFDTEVSSQDDITDAVNNSRSIMELSSAFSYLNSGNLETGRLYDRVVDLGHFSVAHTVTINLIVAGSSVAVENEFNSQRDIMHMSRITVGRTALQSLPPIVVRDEQFVDMTQSITEYVDQKTALIEIEAGASREDKMDFYEMRNLLYPAAKANAFMVSASTRNLQKLIAQKEDKGKEEEYRVILNQINEQLNGIWPEIFTK